MCSYICSLEALLIQMMNTSGFPPVVRSNCNVLYIIVSGSLAITLVQYASNPYAGSIHTSTTKQQALF